MDINVPGIYFNHMTSILAAGGISAPELSDKIWITNSIFVAAIVTIALLFFVAGMPVAMAPRAAVAAGFSAPSALPKYDAAER